MLISQIGAQCEVVVFSTPSTDEVDDEGVLGMLGRAVHSAMTAHATGP